VLIFKMKIINKILAVVFSSIILMGCDQVDIINPDISFKENVVVRAELIAGEFFEGVTFTKTLPLNVPYTISDAEIKTVTAYLKINNIQVVPLHYTTNGIYKALYEFRIKSNNTYELYAVYNKKSIYSKTYIPSTPNISGVIYRDEYFLQCEVVANNNEAFGATWVIPSQNIMADDFYSIESIIDNNTSNKITIRTNVIPKQYRSNAQKLLTYIKVYAFDKAYTNYFHTKSNGQSVDVAFEHGGNNIAWNVEGENIIGLFIGRAIGQSVSHL